MATAPAASPATPGSSAPAGAARTYGSFSPARPTNASVRQMASRGAASATYLLSTPSSAPIFGTRPNTTGATSATSR